ncbi:hypothetical protein ACTXG7_11515 [Mycolicibacterium sp. Dal123E01]|uniref:hypothetical protein n=1 Tax=Mycolicibacterium sp. Dal123E01 TaxID=3457578 RepID=UPI00403E45D7
MSTSDWDDTPESEAPATGSWRRRIDREDRNTYRVLREHFRTQCQARSEVCWLCEGAIDYAGLAYPDPMSFSLDHYVPVSVDESLALTPSNFRASHLQHNQARAAGLFGGRSAVVAGGDDEADWPTAIVDGIPIRYNPELGVPSEIW